MMNNSGTEFYSLPSPYQIIKKLGNGSFGKVYLVVNGENQQQCVIKLLHPVSDDPHFVQQARRLFKQEAEILKKLNHPQIPQLIDYFEKDGEFYLVEEYIEGKTLRHELSDQSWSESATIKLLLEGLQILKDIHSQGIIHRDIKPDNFIRRERDQKLVLIDFGAVKEFNLEQTRILNPTIALGTYGYMPSEQARGKPRKSSDIYAMGMIAIQALTGKNPTILEEDDNGEILWHNVVSVNRDLGKIIEKMTRYDYKLRYQSADDVIQDLENYIRNQQANYCPPTQIIDENSHEICTIKLDEDINKNHHTSQEETQHISHGEFKSLTDNLMESNSLSQSLKEKKISDKKWLKFPVLTTIAFSIVVTAIASGYFIYRQKQAKIKQENADFLASLDTAYNTQSYTECFVKAEARIEDSNNHIAEEELGEYVGKCRLQMAKEKANSFDYGEALNIAKQIPSSNPYYDETQALIEDWSQLIFEEAKILYTEAGQLEEALKEIDRIPENPIREASLMMANQWQEEFDRNTLLVKQSQQDLESGNCEGAIASAKEINGSNYWLREKKILISEGEKCLQNQGITTPIDDESDSLPDNVIICPPILCP